jgi:hypothetical protein
VLLAQLAPQVLKEFKGLPDLRVFRACKVFRESRETQAPPGLKEFKVQLGRLASREQQARKDLRVLKVQLVLQEIPGQLGPQVLRVQQA